MSECTEAHKTFDGVRYVTVKLANQMVSEQNEEIEKLEAEVEALKGDLESAIEDLYGETDTGHLTLEEYKANWFRVRKILKEFEDE